MSASKSTTIYQSPFNAPVKLDSGALVSEAWFDNLSVNQSILSSLDTIQLKTVSRDSCQKNQGPSVFSWFELSIYRPWERSKPRANLATGGELSWRSHTNRMKSSKEEEKLEGRKFTQEDELLKELQSGDIIVARWHTQPPVDNNYGIKGEIVVTFLSGVAERATTSGRRSCYSSSGPCFVSSWDSNVVSKVWFSTPALDQSTLAGLERIQLFTESKDQGWVYDPNSPSRTMFEILVLASSGDQTPLTRGGHELAWRSHANIVASKDWKILDGFVFEREHEIFHMMAPGNCIGVRVSSCRQGWKNYANDGYLELRFSAETGNNLVAPRTQPADDNKLLMETLIEIYARMKLKDSPAGERISKDGGVELRGLIRGLINDPTQGNQTQNHGTP